MNITVCIKQVPDTDDIRWSKENNIIREGMMSILNPYDDFAIQAALDVKKLCSEGEITAVTMGPLQAKEVLVYALARGCDEAVLLTDKKFAGSDTLATSKTLAQCIKTKTPRFDLIICGQFAIDGDTAQTGPSIANHLNLPQVTFVKEILNIDEAARKIVVKQELENGYNIVEAALPCLICMNRGEQEAIYLPRINDYVRVADAFIPVYGAKDIELDENCAGIKGSPTFVWRAFKPEIKREPVMVNCDNHCAQFLTDKIMEVYNS